MIGRALQEMAADHDLAWHIYHVRRLRTPERKNRDPTIRRASGLPGRVGDSGPGCGCVLDGLGLKLRTPELQPVTVNSCTGTTWIGQTTSNSIQATVTISCPAAVGHLRGDIFLRRNSNFTAVASKANANFNIRYVSASTSTPGGSSGTRWCAHGQERSTAWQRPADTPLPVSPSECRRRWWAHRPTRPRGAGKAPAGAGIGGGG